LFAFGLVLGVCALRTRRLGMAIAAHVGFNAAGLDWVALR
jgi:membrane protease YdiL (CAAX protease family)